MKKKELMPDVPRADIAGQLGMAAAPDDEEASKVRTRTSPPPPGPPTG